MLGDWLTGMGGGLTGFASFLRDVFNAVIGLFWQPAAEGVQAGLTDFGELAAGVFGATFIFFGLRFLLKLLHLKF